MKSKWVIWYSPDIFHTSGYYYVADRKNSNKCNHKHKSKKAAQKCLEKKERE